MAPIARGPVRRGLDTIGLLSESKKSVDSPWNGVKITTFQEKQMTRAANPDLAAKIFSEAEHVVVTLGHEGLNMRRLASSVVRQVVIRVACLPTVATISGR
jgi:hypothetical protein